MIKRRVGLILIGFLFLTPIRGAAHIIDFSHHKFLEVINVEYWKHHPVNGIVVDKNGFVHIYHPIRFINTIFNAKVDFTRAIFDSSADFTGAIFDSSADFTEASFHSTVHFFGAVFDSMADSHGATFKSTASFRGATFDDMAVFFGTTFHDRVNFNKVTFHSFAGFIGATFNSSADFRMATFKSVTYFWGASFDSIADFLEAAFDSMATFTGATFKLGVYFTATTLPDSLDFRNVRNIQSEIDFTSAILPRSGKRCEITLFKSDIKKIKLSMNLFHLQFIAKDSMLFDHKRSVYESVLKKLKDDGFMDSYEILDVEYRDSVYQNSGWYDRNIVNPLQKHWWNYGYNKELIFLWSFLFLSFFSLTNLSLYPKLMERVYSIDFLEKIEESKNAGKNKWIPYILQTITYTFIIFFGLKMDLEKFKKAAVSQHPVLFVYLMSIYVLGLVCLGFIVNFIIAR